MKIVKPSVELINPPEYDHLLSLVERAGRTCYKSEDKITQDSAERFIRGLIRRGHESVLEHASITVKFICDRGASHELVRHRLASFSQESTRYCNYSKDKFENEITVICPMSIFPGTVARLTWEHACREAEKAYMTMLYHGCPAEEARAVLPTCLKTELVMTANIREWRYILKLRGAEGNHPQMRLLVNLLYNELTDRYPVFFTEGEEK